MFEHDPIGDVEHGSYGNQEYRRYLEERTGQEVGSNDQGKGDQRDRQLQQREHKTHAGRTIECRPPRCEGPGEYCS